MIGIVAVAFMTVFAAGVIVTQGLEIRKLWDVSIDGSEFSAKIISDQDTKIQRMKKTIYFLTAELRKAKKNDYRDESGRFISEEEWFRRMG